MDWNEEQQRRFNVLRQHELAGPLNPAEQQELNTLFNSLQHAEAQDLAPALEQMQQTQQHERNLADLQIRNEALAALVQQHEQLLGEAHAWLCYTSIAPCSSRFVNYVSKTSCDKQL
jgi:hypothetical protein